jgi:outer membrane receptor protein involved in Fe transport
MKFSPAAPPILTLASLIFACSAAGAAEQVGTGDATIAAADSPIADTRGFEEVVITAQKRTEDIKDVPISVSAINGDELQAKHILTYDDISREVPGVNFNSLGASEGLTNIEIRGVSSTAGSATVGLYIDDVSITTKQLFPDGAAQPRLFDLDRMEVLRGPQGTLYGDSSEGGTIRFITKQPDLMKWSSEFTSDYSQTEHGGSNYFEGAVFNAPIIPGVFAVRGSFGYTSDSGFIDHYSNPAESSSVTLTQVGGIPELLQRGVNDDGVFMTRINGLINVSDNLTISPSFFYQRYKYGDNDAFYPPGEAFSAYPGSPTVSSLWVQDKEVSEPGLDALILPSVTINDKLGFADLTSVTGLFLRQFTRQEDGTFYNSTAFAEGFFDTIPCAGSPAGTTVCNQAQQTQLSNSLIANLPSAVHFASHYGQISQELRLSSPAGAGGIRWVAGLYFENSWIHNTNFQRIPGINTAFNSLFGIPMEQSNVWSAYGAPSVTQLFPNDIDESDNRFYNETQYAGFGQIDYDFLPSLHGSLGGRYADSHENYYSTEIGFYQIGNIDPYYQNGKFSAFTPKGSLTYDLTANSNVYGSASKGFRLGGPTGPITWGPNSVCNPDFNYFGITQQPTKFDSDSLWTYEFGNKNRLFNNHLSIDGAVYATDWKNIQQQIYLPTCGYYFTANVGDAKIYGGELEINYRPISQLTLALSGDAEHAYISSTVNSKLATLGAWLIDVPEYTYNASAAYNAPLQSGSHLVSRIDYSFTGSSYGSYAAQSYDDFTASYNANPNYHNPSYGVLNASVGFVARVFEVTAYAKNLSNDRKIIQQPEINTVYEGYTVRPRTVGITVKLRLD